MPSLKWVLLQFGFKRLLIVRTYGSDPESFLAGDMQSELAEGFCEAPYQRYRVAL